MVFVVFVDDRSRLMLMLMLMMMTQMLMMLMMVRCCSLVGVDVVGRCGAVDRSIVRCGVDGVR